MINVLVVVLVWFSMYAMLGVQAFKGLFYRCYNLQVPESNTAKWPFQCSLDQ